MKVYLDNNATTKIAPEVVTEMMPYLTEIYGNPSSMHDFGVPVSEALNVARRRVQNFIGAAKDSEIIFTACATESDNTAIYSALQAYPERKEIITSAVEHPAILQVCGAKLRESFGICVLIQIKICEKLLIRRILTIFVRNFL